MVQIFSLRIFCFVCVGNEIQILWLSLCISGYTPELSGIIKANCRDYFWNLRWKHNFWPKFHKSWNCLDSVRYPMFCHSPVKKNDFMWYSPVAGYNLKGPSRTVQQVVVYKVQQVAGFLNGGFFRKCVAIRYHFFGQKIL